MAMTRYQLDQDVQMKLDGQDQVVMCGSIIDWPNAMRLSPPHGHIVAGSPPYDVPYPVGVSQVRKR